MSDHYDTLGVPKDADGATIKRAFRRKSAKAHPDRRGGDHRAMVALNRAYETLSDPGKRAHYDQTGQDQAPLPLDVKARGVIMQIFQAVMEHANEQHDIIESVRHQIRKDQVEARNTIAQLRQKVTVYERRRKRVKYKGAERNFVHDLIAQQIAAMTQRADAMEAEAQAVGDRALELLKEFSYEPEQQTSVSFGGVMFTFTG